MKDYYAILGVSPQATTIEIRRAYRQLALELHPDRNPNPEDQQRFLNVNEAYEVLGDPTRRHRYDQLVANPLAFMFPQPGAQAQAQRPRPAYRPRPKPENDIDFHKAAPVLRWINVGILLIVLLVELDFFLGRRLEVAPLLADSYNHIVTESYSLGVEFPLRLPVFEGDEVFLWKTILFGTVIEVDLWQYGHMYATGEVTSIYYPFFFIHIPVIAFSLLGLLMSRNPRKLFNFTAPAIVLFFFFLILWGFSQH